MTTELETYTNDLLYALRLRDVPGPRIAETLAEVESHVAETGEDPHTAFGAPKEYAEEIANALGTPPAPPLWRSAVSWTALAYGVGGAVGGWLVIDGVKGLIAGERSLGQPAVVALLAGMTVLGVLAFGLVRMSRGSADRVLDPRTGRDMAPALPWWVLPVAMTPLVLMLVVAVVLGFASR